MTPFFEHEYATLYHGKCEVVLPLLPESFSDSIVTDPPYHLTTGKKGGSGEASVNLSTPHGRARITTGFMGMTWDGGNIAYNVEMWASALRVLKPGGHLLAFGGPRTSHRMVCAIEDAGFEIRDTIMWIFGSGFPKSLNLAGEWKGWGTALKPAFEPIVVARKPFRSSVAENVLKHGTGALNIDGCRIETDENYSHGGSCKMPRRTAEESADRRYTKSGSTNFAALPGYRGGDPAGRWPANVIHDGSDEVVELFPDDAGAAAPVFRRNGDKFRTAYGAFAGNLDEQGSTFQGDQGSAARFFYCAKADRQDRNEGCDELPERPLNWSSGDQAPGTFQAAGTHRAAANNHPTVKPTELMRYLCRLVTPPGGVVLDHFMGSGSTYKAAHAEGFRFVGIEQELPYCEIAKRRITQEILRFD